MNLFKKLLYIAAGVTGIFLAGCSENGQEGKTDAYSIVVNYADTLCTYTAPDKAEPGETVTVDVNVIKENYHVAFVTANSIACEKIAGSGTECSYRFTMPEKNVEVSIIVIENEPDNYRIYYTDKGDTCKVSGPEWGAVDSEIEVTFTMNEGYEAVKVGSVTFNGNACELSSERVIDNEYTFKFKMPAEDVTIDCKIILDKHVITVNQAENTYITMLNSSDNWDADPVVYDAWKGYSVKFLYGGELGYTADLKAVTESGTDLEVTWLESDETAPNGCWKIEMPDEPITISTVAHEKSDYIGKSFTGTYKGYQIIVGENNMFKSSTPTFSLDMRGNTSFFAKSTDENKFDFDGCYEFNEEDNTFSYLREYSDNGFGEVDFGVSGKWFDNGDAFTYVTNLQMPKPDYLKYYFVSKDDFSYFCAATDQYGVRYLAELEKNGTRSWYYIEIQSLKVTKVNLKFTSGASIAGACTAIAYDGDKALFKYSHSSADSKPVFTMSGNEAGTYKPADGNGADLVLDGFGNAGGASDGTYTIDRNIVTASDGSSYIIDMSSMTYTKVAAAEWTGSLTFIGEQDDAGVWNGVRCTGKFELYLNRTSGGTVKGKARIIVTADTERLNSGDVSYVWLPKTHQIVLSGVLVGSGHSSSSRQDVVLTVSDDLKSMTFADMEYFHSTSSNNDRYLILKDLVLKAQE